MEFDLQSSIALLSHTPAALNAAYEQSGITGILVWPLVDAIPPGLPHENRGLVWADRPWDGYYYVTSLTWVIAQTTQFTAPGWRFAAGANGTLPAGGSYETYLAPGRSAWSTSRWRGTRARAGAQTNARPTPPTSAATWRRSWSAPARPPEPTRAHGRRPCPSRLYPG